MNDNSEQTQLKTKSKLASAVAMLLVGAARSMTGTVNLQFASSADLNPMEYGELHTKN